MQNFIETQMAFAAHLRDPQKVAAPEGIESRRMAIYRRLFYNNIQGFCSNAFPVIKSLLDDTHWHAMVRDFMVQHRCRSPLFNEIAREFIVFLQQQRNDPADPPFLAELAHYEWVELALNIASADYQQTTLEADEDAMQLVLQTSFLAWPLAYQYPVHQISPQNQPQKPLPQKVYLLVYRNSEDKVKFIELNPVSARLLDLLNGGLTGAQAATQIAEELQHPNPLVVMTGARQLIEDWIQRGITVRVEAR